MLINIAESIHEHNQIERGVTQSESHEFITLEQEQRGLTLSLVGPEIATHSITKLNKVNKVGGEGVLQLRNTRK
ncbi:hypothetical protein Lal_00024679 [Lupinus albus]|nr:hypothetical protein Lal_00024679 [Lupinus albus]